MPSIQLKIYAVLRHVNPYENFISKRSVRAFKMIISLFTTYSKLEYISEKEIEVLRDGVNCNELCKKGARAIKSKVSLAQGQKRRKK